MIPVPAHLRRILPEPGSAGSIDRLIWLISILGGLGYLLLPLLPVEVPAPVRILIKASGVGMLALLVFRQPPVIGGRPWGRSWLGTALALSTLGDIFLAGRGTNSFIYGLSSFLLAHLTYLCLFVQRWRRPLRPPIIRLSSTAAFLTFSLFFSQWLAPGLGELAVPVMIYVSAITLMVVASLWANFSNRWVVIGAILFMVSDSILAADKFRHEAPLSSYLIWATYYLGQYGIAMGCLIDTATTEKQQ